MENGLEFLVLGPLEVRRGAEPVTVGAAKQRALLASLLLHPAEVVSTHHLVEAIWGEHPPATAEKLVQGYVHALRRQLGDDVLETRPPGYRIRTERTTSDLVEFERLIDEARRSPTHALTLRRQALDLWRGPPLADVVLEGADRTAIARLADLRLSTQIDQIDARLARGEQRELVGELESLTHAHPYQERLAAQLMLSLYRSGRQAEALECYRGLRRRLDDELGLQPSQELRDLEAAMLRQDAHLAAPPAAPIRSEAGPPPVDVPEPEVAPHSRRTRGALAVALGAAAVAAVVIAFAALGFRSEPDPLVVRANSVGIIDIQTNRVVASVPVGIRPGPVAYGEGAVWVANLEDRTLSRVDPVTRTVVKNIALPATPDAVAVGAGAVWVVNGRLGTLYRVDPAFDRLTDSVRLGDRAITFAGAGVDVGLGSVWAAFGDDTVARAQPMPPRADGIGAAGSGPVAVVAAFGAVWVANSGDATVQRFSVSTFEAGPTGEFTVGPNPAGLAAGAGAIWVTSSTGDSVTRLDAAGVGSNSGLPIPVGAGPAAVAVGAGSVWIANAVAGSVSRVDPETNGVVATTPVGDVVSGLAVAEDEVWVSVQAP